MTGVGEDNSLRLLLNQSHHGKPIKYRIYISEVGTTVSKVLLKPINTNVQRFFQVYFDINPLYVGEQRFHIHGIHFVQVGISDTSV